MSTDVDLKHAAYISQVEAVGEMSTDVDWICKKGHSWLRL